MAYKFDRISVQVSFGTDGIVFHDEDTFFVAEYGLQGHFISITGFHCVSFVQARERHEAKGDVSLLRQGVKCLQFLPILRFQFFPCRNDGQWPASRQVDQRIRHFFVLPVEDGEVGMPIEVCSPGCKAESPAWWSIIKVGAIMFIAPQNLSVLLTSLSRCAKIAF